ncbi:ABC transporter ATP-binding protein [Streptomyces varsoviensis]|nr:ABC transporter ATP-binding protein [Streptomyces varsoviensis]
MSFAYPARAAGVPASLAMPPKTLGPPGASRSSGPPGPSGPEGDYDRPRPVLEHITFTAEPGMSVGVVGSSGSGKSTLARLLNRSWEPTAGRVEIGETDVRELALDGLQRHIGMVTQDPYLFHGSIRDNLRLARPDADDARLLAACATAQVLATIRRLPEGLDTVIGDRGVQLSGGERQRLAIARMLLREPEVVVLDEATSHLDNATEHALQEALRPFLRSRTCLIIAHRLSTVRHADLILVLADGKIAEQGTHTELARRAGPYRRLLDAQPPPLTRPGEVSACS